MSRTAESFLINEKRIQLADNIQQKAREYKEAFAKVEEICDNDLELSGCMNQVIRAINHDHDHDRDHDHDHDESIIIMPEVIAARDAFNELTVAMNEMIEDDVPGIIAMEFSRRILEESITDAHEYVYRGA